MKEAGGSLFVTTLFSLSLTSFPSLFLSFFSAFVQCCCERRKELIFFGKSTLVTSLPLVVHRTYHLYVELYVNLVRKQRGKNGDTSRHEPSKISFFFAEGQKFRSASVPSMDRRKDTRQVDGQMDENRDGWTDRRDRQISKFKYIVLVVLIYTSQF